MPEPETEAALRVHVRPVLGDVVVARLTVPVKPFNADIVMVEDPLAPEFTFTVAGEAAIVKSWKTNVAVAE